MSEQQRILVANSESRLRGGEYAPPVPPVGARSLASICIVMGLTLAIAGFTDVALFYWPSHFGQSQWEFGTIAQTLDAMPLPTVGVALLAIGIRSRGADIVWSRTLAVGSLVIALVCAGVLVLFVLDIPVALRTLQAASTGPRAQQAALMAPSMKRGMAKAILFGVCYTAAYAWLARTLWRAPAAPS